MNMLSGAGAHLTGLEQLQLLLNSRRRGGIAELLDMHLVAVSEGHAVLESMPGVHVYNLMGTAHGGYAATLLDTVCGFAVLSKLSAAQIFTTIELKVSYHRPITQETGTVRAEGRILTIGRRAAFTEAKLTDTAGKLYASATSSLLLMPKPTHPAPAK